MEGKHRIAFLFAVFFFAGSIVLLAAHELRNRTLREGRGSADDARRLIRELRGEPLVKKSGDMVNPEAMPTRKPGRFLPEKDRERLNSLLRKVLPAPE